jgi:D-alanyl-lipoteichoic acid acyltransferase DltB (MBOAT superfamily)
VLFNTLAFAHFFAAVFGVAWLLTNRRYVALAPWCAVAGFGVFMAPAAEGWAVLLAALIVSLGLVRATPSGDRIPWRIAAASVLVNYVALAFFTLRLAGMEPFTHALENLGLPLRSGELYTLPIAIGGLVATVLVIRARRVRLLFILGASYVFYAHWDYRFLPLIWASSTMDWLLGNAIDRAENPRARKVWLAATVVLNLGVLGFFKYFNFGIDSARAALSAAGIEVSPVTLSVALPVGVSFFTFESMSYVIDIYRRELKPQKSYVEYLSFVAFFPHLVAGPIVRPRDLLPQLAGPARFSAEEASEGLFLVAVGLLKKVAIGDYLAVNLVDRVFDAPLQYSALECYAAVLGYAVQIYCDFSGYTDIAIGVALLIGVRMPKNFDSPYKSASITEFWRRWHISLSTWLRDYLYVPLGGNRKGRVRTYVNLMLTMLLGGLWHGASFTFVVWGALHGWALAASRAVEEAGPRRQLAAWLPAVLAGPLLGLTMTLLVLGPSGLTAAANLPLVLRFAVVGWVLGALVAVGALVRAGGRARSQRGAPRAALQGPGAWLHLGAVAATFHVVCAGWIFFRAETFQKAAIIFTQLMTLSTHHTNLAPSVLAVLAVGLVSHGCPEAWYTRAQGTFSRLPAPAQGFALLGVGLVLRELASAEAVPFVYFQF